MKPYIKSKNHKNGELNEKDLGVCKVLDNRRSLSPYKYEWIEKVYLLLIEKRTESERILYDRLKWFVGDMRIQQPFAIKGRIYFADIAIPSRKLIIEVDGDYHRKSEQIVKDKEREGMFKKVGYSVLRIRNKDVVNEKKIRELVSNIKKHNIILK